MPPKRSTKSKVAKEVDSPTFKKSSKTQESHNRQKTAAAVLDFDELAIGSDDVSPVRRSPRKISKKEVTSKSQPRGKKAAKITPDNTPERPQKTTQPKPRRSQKAGTKVVPVDDEQESPKIQVKSKGKAPKRGSSKTTEPESDLEVEQNVQPKTRASKKRASLSNEDLPTSKRVRTWTSIKTPESPSVEVSIDSSMLEESPSPVKISKSSKASLSSKAINGKKGSTPSIDDINEHEELKKANKQLEELTKRYEELKKIGIQDAEKTFSEYKHNAEMRFKASDEAIQRLRKELAKLKEQKSLKKQLENQKLLEQQAEEIESLNKQVEKLKSESEQINGEKLSKDNLNMDLSLQLYQELSQLNIAQIEKTDQEIIFTCEQTGGKGTLKYLLRQDLDDLETFHYEPLLDEEEDADLIEQIPSYFNEAISFSKAYASLFFWRALDSLKKETKKQ